MIPPVGPESNPKTPQILEQLDRVLNSAPFRTSKRCSDLLRHVVNAACEGNLDFLKERTVGIAVFDRDPEYDTNQDPVVRNTAGQVRKRLAQYYLELGHDQELRIELPAGAYVPQFYQPSVRQAEPPRTPPPPVETTPTKPRRYGRLAAGGAVVLLVAALAFALIEWHTPTSLELFWAPMLKQPGAVVLCVGQGHTYKLKGDRDQLFEGGSQGEEGFIAPRGNIPLSDLVPIWDRAIGINDAQTLSRLSALFGGFGKPVEFRGGRSTSLGDLRGKSTVLIGAFNNSWTLSLTGELRFYFAEDAASKTYLVRDRLHPENHAWEVRTDQQPTQDYEDYAIVSRVYNTTTEQPVVVAAGIKGGGTAAAGEFLTNPAYLEVALANAPRHWEKRNVQFVLKTRLFGGAAGPPQIVASHYW
jgi:hypothetical protein